MGLGVDEIEDAKFPSFHEAQQLSTSYTYLIETEHVENRAFSGRLETALGAGGRMIVFNDLQMGHLSKRQMVVSNCPLAGPSGADSLWNP